MGPYHRLEPVTLGFREHPKLSPTRDALACQNGGRPAPRPFEARSPAGAECFRAFPRARGTQERRGRERPRPEPGSCVDGSEGEGRPDVSGAAISCFSAVFLSFGWWLPLCFAFQSAEGQAAWTAVPALGAPPPAASHPPARPALPEPAASRLSDRPPPPRPTERPRCRPSSVWLWETGECTAVLGAAAGVSLAAPLGAGGTRVPAGPKSLELA